MKRLTLLMLTLSALLGAACDPIKSPSAPIKTGPQSWIDAPLDGSAIPLAPVEVLSHSSDPLNVVQVELSVNGVVVRTDPNLDPSQRLVTMKQPWVPNAPGNYRLLVRAQNSASVWGDYAEASVSIQPTGKTATPTPTATSTATPTATSTSPRLPIPTSTPTTQLLIPTRTRTPSPTRTFTYTPSPTPVVGPPSPQFQFWADSTSLNAGQCTILHWRTQNVQAVYLDGEGVAGNEDRQVCPATTTTYTLNVVYPGGSQNLQVLIRVAGAPPAPTPTETLSRFVPPTATRTNTPVIIR